MTKIHLNPSVLKNSIYSSIEESKKSLKTCLNTSISIPGGFSKTTEVKEIMQGIGQDQISLVNYQFWLDSVCSKFNNTTEENVVRLNKIVDVEIKKNEKII